MRRLSGRFTGGGRLREPQGFSSEKKSEHIYFKEGNLLHAISKLRHVQFHFVTKVLPIF